MKKLLSVIFSLVIVVNLNAQKADSQGIQIIITDNPDILGVHDYKTYDFYSFSDNPDLNMICNGHLGGTYKNFASDRKNADLKIIFRLEDLVSERRDLAIKGKVRGTIFVYDKSGNEVYIKQTEYPGAAVMDARHPLPPSRPDRDWVLRKLLFEDCALKIIGDMLDRTQYTTRPKSEPMLMVAKTSETVAGTINKAVTTIKKTGGVDAETILRVMKQQEPVFLNIAQNYNGSNTSFYKGIANYNLAFISIFTGNAAKARKYGHLVQESDLDKSMKNKITRLIELYIDQGRGTPRLVQSITGPSTVSTHDCVERISFFVINGKVKMENGETFNGKVMISRIKGTPESPNLSDYEVRIGNFRTLLSKIYSITDKNNNFYLVHYTGTLLQTVKQTAKLSIMQPVFPSYSSVCYFKKPDEARAVVSPLIGAKKWFAGYFDDCPVLLKMIENKEIKGDCAIGEFYMNECGN